jgi:hypothetical protein
MALAASLAMFIAALRLLTRTDQTHGRSYVTFTAMFFLYLAFHGLAALLPFLAYQLWPQSWQPLITMSPWLMAVISPLVVNEILKVDGLDLPEATGPFATFRAQVRSDFEHRMIDAEFAAMRKYIAQFAEGMTLFTVTAMALQNVPLQLAAEKAVAFREALRNAKTTEDAMELYIRHIGKKSFRTVFGRTSKRKTLAGTPLFDEFERRTRQLRAPADVAREIA